MSVPAHPITRPAPVLRIRGIGQDVGLGKVVYGMSVEAFDEFRDKFGKNLAEFLEILDFLHQVIMDFVERREPLIPGFLLEDRRPPVNQFANKAIRIFGIGSVPAWQFPSILHMTSV